MNQKYCRAGVGLLMGRVWAQGVLELMPAHCWARLVPMLEPAGVWLGAGSGVFWG